MRIGVDARELCGHTTGVGRYLGGLLHEWAALTPLNHEFVLYAHDATTLPLDTRRLATRIVPGPPGTWWEQVRLPRAAAPDHLDAWFAPAYSAPLRLHVPTVVAIHDLSFAAHPEWFSIREGARRRWLARQSAARASAVVTISEFSKGELIERLGVPAARIHVIPPGIGAGGSGLGAGSTHSAAPANAQLTGTASPQPPAPSPNVLFVGSIFNRRHVVDLIQAFTPIARAHPDAALDIVGDNRSYPRQDLRRTIASEGLQAQVRWHEYVTDERLEDLYAHARAFAFLSEYEGLGLTPLEALAAGVPPVMLDTTVARESCGDAGVYVPLRDIPAITRALEAVLFDQATRTRILDAAAATLARYSWSRAARETLAVLEQATSAGYPPPPISRLKNS
jgi:glycosyltransferase involved in cell wall biosynthesis